MIRQNRKDRKSDAAQVWRIFQNYRGVRRHKLARRDEYAVHGPDPKPLPAHFLEKMRMVTEPFFPNEPVPNAVGESGEISQAAQQDLVDHLAVEGHPGGSVELEADGHERNDVSVLYYLTRTITE